MNELAERVLERTAKAELDPVKLAAELSHQLEEARARIETLEAALRELRLLQTRAEAARDAMKDLLLELLKR